MNDNKKFLKIIIISQIISSIFIFVIISFLLKDIVYFNNNTLYMLTISESKKYMKQSVSNTIINIDTKRERIYNNAKDNLQILENSFKETPYDYPLSTIKNTYLKLLDTQLGESIQMELIDNSTKKIICSSEKNKNINLDKELFVKKIKKKEYTIRIYTRSNYLDNIVKKQIYNDIHNLSYQDNEYIWVNEILNYEGGDNYATRIIHPNLPSTEGDFLSTNTKDIRGNYPYLKELEGIKQNGEIVQTYYFKNKNDSNTSEKLSYSKLYKPFNWVISTGKPLNDIFKYTNKLNTYNSNKFIIIIGTIALFITFTSLLLISLIIIVNKKHYEFINEYIKNETERDLLTGALTRRWAEHFFNNILNKYQISNSPLFIMIDIDNFKYINDTYGHDIGDMVLKRVTNSIKICLNEEDRLIRWGGEEFLIFCPNMNNFNEFKFTEKILSTVNSIVFESNNNIFKVSISMGGAYMKDNMECNYAIKLADESLYKAKSTGKNRYCNNSKDWS